MLQIAPGLLGLLGLGTSHGWALPLARLSAAYSALNPLDTRKKIAARQALAWADEMPKFRVSGRGNWVPFHAKNGPKRRSQAGMGQNRNSTAQKGGFARESGQPFEAAGQGDLWVRSLPKMAHERRRDGSQTPPIQGSQSTGHIMQMVAVGGRMGAGAHPRPAACARGLHTNIT